MSTEQFWTIAGIAIGWALTNLTNIFGDLEGRRRTIGRLLSQLVALDSQLRTLNMTSEMFKDSSASWADYERARKGLNERHFMQGDVSIEKLDDLIADLAGVRPIQAIEIRGVLGLLAKAKSANFSASILIESVYVRLLSAHEVGLDAARKALRKHVLKLAWAHSPATWLVLVFRLWRQEDSVKRNLGSVAKILEETMREVRDAKAPNEPK
jgi:hypothetical protein